MTIMFRHVFNKKRGPFGINVYDSRAFSGTKLPPSQYQSIKKKRDGSLLLYNPNKNKIIGMSAKCAENGCQCQIINSIHIEKSRETSKYYKHTDD